LFQILLETFNKQLMLSCFHIWTPWLYQSSNREICISSCLYSGSAWQYAFYGEYCGLFATFQLPYI